MIITALPLERSAVIEHLRDVVEEPPLRGSIYRRGVFDERSEPWDVIVAEVGAGNEGAAAEAERILGHYSPDVALFVGIAGALKDLKHGDVVASTKVYGYESGKDEKKGFKPRPGSQLSAYALEQRARYEAGEAEWRQRIKQPSEETTPDAKVAPIAAGEKVVASNRSMTFKFLRQQYGDAVAVEMEGHGFLLGVHMNHPTLGLVVRGISDLVEGKNEENDEKWQPVAARHAAAFAFQVLSKHAGGGRVARGSVERPGLDPAWQEKHLQDARATAGPRYSADLHVGTPLHEVFEALGHTNEWRAVVRTRRRTLSKLVKRFSDCVMRTEESGWGAPFPASLRDTANALREPIDTIERALGSMLDDSSTASAEAAKGVAVVLPQLRELEVALRADLEAKHGGGADSVGFRQWQAEYQASFPAENLDTARELIKGLEEFEMWVRSPSGRAAGKPAVLLVGNAGVGKTHAICDVGHDRLRRGLYTVILFGEQFTGGQEPWERMRQLLGLGPLPRDELLQLLDDAGASSGHLLLLFIDGLNESRPRSYWRTWLASVASQVSRYPNIRVCVSCRSTYEAVALPESHGLERVEHVGFDGMEFAASKHFFPHYGLEPPVGPNLHPEFSNPLFLRLACETLRAAGERRMPSGWHGLRTALRAFLREKNRAFAVEYERDERERVPERALEEFIGEVERVRRVYLRWSDANAITTRAQPPGYVGPSVLDWLIRAGLLINDVDPANSDPDSEEVVRVAFERFGDHLLAERLLNGVKRDELELAVEGGALTFAFTSEAAVSENRGLVEALSIHLSERTDLAVELPDLVPAGTVRTAVLRATISALPWRDPERMTTRTQDLLLEGLTTRGYGAEVFDNILAVATQVTAPDAVWLHALLAKQRMASRDGFVCHYLYERVGVSSAVERLLRSAFEVEAIDLPEQVCARWCILLLWFCVAADRRVRDRATKALVAITQARPKVWSMLINEFASVDDDYVVERCFCAAYGALLRSRDPEAEREVAETAYRVMFAESTVRQNALIRDHARCIIELANYDGVLPASVEMKRVRAPYKSDWPLAIPSEQDVEAYKLARRDYPRLYASCLDDDFFIYSLPALEPYEHAVSRKEMGRWILHHIVSDMGYGGPALASYDGFMITTHGGGRGRPGWAERIGKKYQRIAMQRLAARLADHVKPDLKKSWEPKVKGVPLVYPRGRDIDPSLLARANSSTGEGSAWWLALNYDFASVANQSHAEWTAKSMDVPSSEEALQPLARADGGEWQVLETYPRWSERNDEDGEERSRPYRQLWMQIRGYLVKRRFAGRVFKWMSQQHFMGRWMHEGADLHSGYVGEYPWGILFTAHPDRWSSGRQDRRAPARLLPVCTSLTSNYEDDAYQGGGLTVHVPAQAFFEKERPMRWDGLGGYHDEKARPRFLDPSVIVPGPSALLVDRTYLLEFLERHDVAVVWTVLGEKIVIGQHSSVPPRLEFSRTHLLDSSGTLQSSELLAPQN